MPSTRRYSPHWSVLAGRPSRPGLQGPHSAVPAGRFPAVL